MLNRARDAVIAEHAGQQPPFPEVVSLISPRSAGQAWVLRRWDRHEGVVTLHGDEASALADLAAYVRGVWTNIVGEEGVPEHPPTDDRESVRLYYGPERDNQPDEGYSIYVEEITRRGRTRMVPLDYRFPEREESEQANRDATFHRQTEDNELPCVEVDGVPVFTYLDHKTSAVRVSVHLDSAEDRLVRPDGTVPLSVEVGDTVVLDDSAEDTPRRDLLTLLLDAADDRQQQAIREAAFAAGVLWRSPTCQCENPGEAACCEGTAPCGQLPHLCLAQRPGST
ncbi:hypothetical protein [Streptomyces sp. NPDC056628]|uniref:hypothetical protein n=1 Tax=Streptomyces sp. NPDC056628 TaxID=3345882 RepID=UPI003673D42F